jgi:hypothetical protein
VKNEQTDDNIAKVRKARGRAYRELSALFTVLAISDTEEVRDVVQSRLHSLFLTAPL